MKNLLRRSSGPPTRPPWTLVTAISLLVMIDIITAKEYCHLEPFNATCPPNEAVLMQRAKYGRLRLGTCLTQDFFIGCSADVLRIMDTICSGRGRCSFLTDKDFFNQQPCPKDLVAYMDADYTCIRGASASQRTCQRNQPLNLTAPEGFLTSLVARNTGAGSRKCPWVVSALPGQRINISLFDFNMVSSSAISNIKQCIPLASVREMSDSGLGKEELICSTGDRNKVVFTSKGNKVMIAMNTRFPNGFTSPNPYHGEAAVPSYFLEYKVVGCPDPLPIEGATWKRRGEQIDVTCNGTMQSWHLVCRGTAWVGQVGNCSHDSNSYFRNHHVNSDSADLDFPNGLWIAVIIGVALGVMLGFCLLVLVYMMRKRRRSHSGPGMLREANALLSETKPDVADINKTDHVTYACRFHPNDLDSAHVAPPDVGDSCTLPSNIQMTILHNPTGRPDLRVGQLYDKPGTPKDSTLRRVHFSTFKHGTASNRPPDTISLSSNCDYDRNITSIACPHNFVHYGDPALLRQQQPPPAPKPPAQQDGLPCSNNNSMSQ